MACSAAGVRSAQHYRGGQPQKLWLAGIPAAVQHSRPAWGQAVAPAAGEGGSDTKQHAAMAAKQPVKASAADRGWVCGGITWHDTAWPDV